MRGCTITELNLPVSQGFGVTGRGISGVDSDEEEPKTVLLSLLQSQEY